MSLALALLQALGGAFLVILFFVMLGGGLILVGLFGGRASGVEGESGASERSLYPARALCVLGMSFALAGAFFVSIATDVLGLVLGMVGYVLGARVLGAVAVIVAIAALLVGLTVGPLAVPGSYDRQTDGISRPSSGE